MDWPWTNAWCGDLDLCGFKKPQSWFRDVLWERRAIAVAARPGPPPGLHEQTSWWGWPEEELSWNWPRQKGEPMLVRVFSRCERVRLELNGRIIGEKKAGVGNGLIAEFSVPYEPGTLVARGMENGRVRAEATLATTGPPAEIRLSADRRQIRADRNDLSYVTVRVVDARGRLVPDARIPLEFLVSGEGEFAGQANGCPNEPASFQTPGLRTFRGRCLVILRPTHRKPGEITLHAKSPGMPEARFTVLTTDAGQ